MSRPIRVVVVDDHALVRTGLVQLLEGADDISVIGTAADGVEAIEVVRRDPPDVVLMDLQMPRGDGVAATRAIRALPGPRSATRIVALTAYAMDGDRERFLAEGMDDYLSKPVQMTEMVRALERVNAARPG